MNRLLLAAALGFSLYAIAGCGLARADDSLPTCPKARSTRTINADADAIATPAPVPTHAAGAAPINPRARAGGRLVSPRWHSLLPGMFR